MRPLKQSEIRMLAFLGLSLVLTFLYRAFDSAPSVALVTGETPEFLENQLARARQVAATVPAKTQVLKTVREQLQAREKGIMKFATAPQAQAHLLEVVRRISSQDKIELRGGDFAAPAVLGGDYGQVQATITFETTIESFVNFLSDLSKESELIAPAEIHINAGNAKNKTVSVRMTLAGVVPKQLVPEKKGFAATL